MPGEEAQVDLLEDAPVDVLAPDTAVAKKEQNYWKWCANGCTHWRHIDISTIVGDHRQLRRQTEETNDRFIRDKIVNEIYSVSPIGFIASKVPKTRLEAALQPQMTRSKAHHSPRRSVRIQSFNSSNVAVVNHEIRKDDDSISLIKSRWECATDDKFYFLLSSCHDEPRHLQ